MVTWSLSDLMSLKSNLEHEIKICLSLKQQKYLKMGIEAIDSSIQIAQKQALKADGDKVYLVLSENGAMGVILKGATIYVVEAEKAKLLTINQAAYAMANLNKKHAKIGWKIINL